MTDLRERYEKKFLRNDLLVCLILIVAIFLFDKRLKWNIFCFVFPSLNSIYSAITSGSLTIFVFLLTCISIIIAFLQNNKLEQLAASNQPITIMRTFFSAIRWSGILAAVSFIAPLSWVYNIKVVFFWLTFSLLSISIIRLIRTIWIVKKLAILLFTLKEPKQNKSSEIPTFGETVGHVASSSDGFSIPPSRGRKSSPKHQ